MDLLRSKGNQTGKNKKKKGDHTCAQSYSGDLFCWGRNDAGQVGNGLSGDNVVTPTLVSGLSGVYDVALGGFYFFF